MRALVALLCVLPQLAAGIAHARARASSSLAVSLKRQRRTALPLHSQNRSRHQGHHPSEYFGLISVGSPAEDFHVLFDTGSGNLLLPSADCDGVACKKHRRLNASASTSSVSIAFLSKPNTPIGDDGDQDVINLVYGTGEATGVIIQDKVCVGSTCARANLVAAVEESAAPFADAPFDGIFGLGLTSLSEAPAFNVLDCMVRDKAVKKGMFSVYLGETDAEESEILFGSFRAEHMVGSLFWAPVMKTTGFWQVPLDAITLGGRNLAGSSNASAVLDTGTSLLAGPPAVINELLDKLNVATNCSNFHSLPDIAFVVAGHVLSLSPKDYVDRDTVANECTLPLMTQDVKKGEGQVWILGDPFLRKYYTVYNRDKLEVGFALAAHGRQGATAGPAKHLRSQ